jgi:hypothetical protein
MPKVRDLTPGTRFFYPESRRWATLVGLGPSGARVLFDSSTRKVEFTAREVEGEKVVEFESPGRPVLVSDYSDVEVDQ